MENLRITTVQTSLFWESPEDNLEQLENLLLPVSQTDLILLPEMFTTGFSMNAEKLFEEMDGSAVQWMQGMAIRKNAVVSGSLIVKENGKYYNRLLWCSPDNTLLYYDKHHLFTLAGEEKVYTAGKTKIFPELKGWKILPLICYDLRFPVWARNSEPYYDLLIYVANWPAVRSHAWKILLQARAIENQCYLAGVNRTGKDGNGFEYSGDTMVCDMSGEIISNRFAGNTQVETTELNSAELIEYRKKYAFLKDADRFSLNL